MLMSEQKGIKKRLHTRNRNRENYDLQALIDAIPELADFVQANKRGEDSVDFANPAAVKTLNRALLHHYYGIEYWAFSDKNLCPPIPGRADYLHHMADVLAENNFGNIPRGNKITGYDIGVGASCIYPIIGVAEYDWNFIGSDIDASSIASSEQIIAENAVLHDKIECRLQANKRDVFYGVLKKEDKIDFVMCNPPFHASIEEAKRGTKRKVKNLTGKKTDNPKLNFAGISSELVCEGGEHKFVHNIITESKKFAKSCLWYSTLVSKQSNVKGMYTALEELEAVKIRTIAMGTSNKSSRVVAWTFHDKAEQKEWRETRWK